MLLRDLVGVLIVAGAIWGLKAGVYALTNVTQADMWILAITALFTACLGTLLLEYKANVSRLARLRRGENHAIKTNYFHSEQLEYFVDHPTAENANRIEDRNNAKYVKSWKIYYILIFSSTIIICIFNITNTFIEDDNFRIVRPEIYRSGQLRSDEWQESYKANPYRSVLNLRGAAQGQPWYVLERNFAAEHGLEHYDFALSANIAPTLNQMEALIGLMRAAPKPLLIHCKEGADRSGLVSALYLYAVQGVQLEEASRQLSLWYGHFPWLMSRTGAMDEALRRFVEAHPAS